MSKTLIVVEQPGGRTERVELSPGAEHEIRSDGPAAVTVYAGGGDD